jgi:hypothetical protein
VREDHEVVGLRVGHLGPRYADYLTQAAASQRDLTDDLDRRRGPWTGLTAIMSFSTAFTPMSRKAAL